MVIIMCGLPASGKSTLAAKIAKKLGAEIVSSDDVRDEMFGLPTVSSSIRYKKDNHAEVFKEVNWRVLQYVLAEKDVIVDATNYKRWNRENIIYGLPVDTDVRCIFVDTPLATCIERNSKRENSMRIVPQDVIEHMCASFENPVYYEGFNEILRVTPEGQTVMPRPETNMPEGCPSESSNMDEKTRLAVADMFIHDMVTAVLTLTKACATCKCRDSKCLDDFYSNPEGCFCREYAEKLRARAQG